MISHRNWLNALAITALAAAAVDLASLSGCSSDARPNAPPPAMTLSPHAQNGMTARLPGATSGFATLPSNGISGSHPALPQTSSGTGWNIPTSTPVRPTPAGYGAFVSQSPTDLVAFAVDNYKAGSITAPGIAAATAASSIANWSSLSATEQLEAEESTVFLLTDIYAPTPTLLGWRNSSLWANSVWEPRQLNDVSRESAEKCA